MVRKRVVARETGERTTPHGRGSCSLGARSTAHDLFYDNSDQARALAPHEWDEPLKAWQTWAIPEGPALYFWRTDAGEEWLKRKPVPRSWVKRSWVGIKDQTGGVDVPDLS